MRRNKIICCIASVLMLVSCTANVEKVIVEEVKPVITEKEAEKLEDVTSGEEDDSDKDNIVDESNNNLSTESVSWWFVPNSEHKTPGINNNINYNIEDYGGMYVGDTSRKVLYLTMDEGYENGYTSQILDVLKANNVKCTFFVTAPYIDSNPELIKRMVNEGHSVGNHSNTHPSMPTILDSNTFNNELKVVEDKYKNLIGKDMPKLFRPPMGHYSEQSLQYTKNLGYKSVFWSFAYADWDTNNQPEAEFAKEKILGGTHNGAILLLHAVSKTNTEILDSVIKQAKAEGYSFELIEA